MNNFKLIQKRAEIMNSILDEKLNRGSDYIPQEFHDAYKASFCLMKRSISKYVRAFRQMGLDFEISNVDIVYQDLGEDLPGILGLMVDERKILKELKRKIEAEEYKRNVISL